MPHDRQPLGTAVVTLVVVDAILVAVLLTMLVTSGRLGALLGAGGGSGAPSPTPTGPVAEAVVFASPTRNIACTIELGAARCEIAHYMYDKPTVEACDGDVGHEIEVTAEGARWVCRTGSPPPPPADDVPDLRWGNSHTAYGFTCTSEGNGVTCRHNASGHAFSLARREFSLG